MIFDEFTRNMTRVNSSAVIVGNMRFGKSTLSKNRLKARALRGDFLRTFDITGEFSDLTKKLGGRVLNMDGTDGIINLLEIFQAGDTDHTSYTRHLSKIKTTYQFLKPTAKSEEINTLIEMLEILYEKWGLKPSSKKETRITGLPASPLSNPFRSAESFGRRDAAHDCSGLPGTGSTTGQQKTNVSGPISAARSAYL